jgi:hypothetical protein
MTSVNQGDIRNILFDLCIVKLGSPLLLPAATLPLSIQNREKNKFRYCSALGIGHGESELYLKPLN